METAAAVKARMKELSATFPPSINYSIPLDTTKAVTAGIREIVFTLLEALGLVVIVVFMFLQGWRATLIPLLAVPVSLIGTFIIFPALGFSINTLSLFGLVLAIGLVVDDAIIVVEAVEHHIDEGMDPKAATRASHGRGRRPGRRHRADSRRRIHSHGCHSGNHRPPLPAVRSDHCDLGTDFGVQRAYPQPGAGGTAAEAQDGSTQEEPPGPRIRLFQSIFGKTTDSFVRTSNVLIHKSGYRDARARSGSPQSQCSSARACPEDSFPPKTRATCSSLCNSPIASSAQRTDAAQQKITDALLKTPGVEGVIAVTDFSLLTQVQSTNSGFFFVSLKPWEARKRKEEQLEYIQSNLQKQPAA